MSDRLKFTREETIRVKRGPGVLSEICGVILKTTRGTGFSGQRSFPGRPSIPHTYDVDFGTTWGITKNIPEGALEATDN